MRVKIDNLRKVEGTYIAVIETGGPVVPWIGTFSGLFFQKSGKVLKPAVVIRPVIKTQFLRNFLISRTFLSFVSFPNFRLSIFLQFPYTLPNLLLLLAFAAFE